MSSATTGLLLATFAACFVEAVEAATIVLAVGFTRGWRSTLYGVGAALAVLAVATAILRVALVEVVPESALQLVVGALLLLFGLQWMRKAVLRSAGLKALHDEAEIFDRAVSSARSEGVAAGSFDAFAFVVSFKGVLLEGMEVVLIVLTFGLSADNIPAAVVAAALAVVVVGALAAALRRPLAMIDENLLKYGVSVLLASFGLFWTVEGMGALRPGGDSLSWPGADWSILALIVVWLAVSRLAIAALSRRVPASEPSLS
jgi:uncharacterized membrane protein